MMKQILICDDEIEHLKQIESMVNTVLDLYKIDYQLICVSNLDNLIESDALYTFDIILLDIKLKEKNGIDIASLIRSKSPKIQIIFITAFIEYAEDIFDVDPTYFLIKPVNQEKLEKALSIALKKLDTLEKEIVIKIQNSYIRLPSNDILYIESSGRQAIIHTATEDYSIYCKLDDFQKNIGNQFIRCHKSYIVNMEKVKNITYKSFYLGDKTIIPISKSKQANVKLKFLKYIGEDV